MAMTTKNFNQLIKYTEKLTEWGSSKEESKKPVNILMVDDRQENLIALEAVLFSPHYRLVRANSGEEALKQVLMEDFAIILLDVQMPGLNGFETAKLIKSREKSKNIPIIFITAISQEVEHVLRGYKIGAIDYIFKPFNPETLKLKVAEFVKIYQNHEQMKQQSEFQRKQELEEERKLQFSRLEKLVEERTLDLLSANEKLQQQIQEKNNIADDLHRSREHFRKIFECSPCLISIQSLKDKRYIDVNSSWLSFTGYSYDEVINHHCDLHLTSEAGPGTETECSKLEEPVHNASITYVTKDGETRKGLLSTEIIKIQGESCLLKVITDVTEKRHLEREIARLDQLNLIGEMAAGIAHEVRNPLTTVRGFLQMSRDNQEVLSPPFIELMIEELDRANAIITEFLSLAKNKVNSKKNQSLNDIIDSLYPLIQAEALLLDRHVSMNLGEISALDLDEKEIRQLLLNLSLNGIEAMPSGGVLAIRTYEENQSVVLEVTDQGTGIKEEWLTKIGTPFFTTKEKGTGLGLAICYSIANRHQATIDIQSSQKGTSFFVRFTR